MPRYKSGEIIWPGSDRSNAHERMNNLGMDYYPNKIKRIKALL